MALIVTPVPASQTGLTPTGSSAEGYTLHEDSPEGQIDIGMSVLDFSLGPVWEEQEEWVDLDTMLRRAAQVRAYGSLGFAKLILEAQKEGRNIIPRELRKPGVVILLPRTTFQNKVGKRGVACLDAGGGPSVREGMWGVYFSWWGRYTNPFQRGALFVRPRE